METALALAPSSIDTAAFFKPAQVDLIKRQIAKNVSDDELKLFLYQCARTGLDPFSRQIYAITRNEWNAETRSKQPKMSIQTGIDGLRLIADRTGKYSPGPDNEYEYDAAGALRRATAHVRKRTGDGTWHVISASAFFQEYAQVYEGKPTKMWAEKPHIMLGKCAEALALRKAFPAEMSGIYTSDEMGQTEVAPPPEYTPPATPETSKTSQPTLAVVPSPKADSPTPGASDGSETSAAGTTTGTTDTGEAPSAADLDDLESLAFKELKLKKPYFRNWFKRYFGIPPEEWTKVQLADAMSCLMALGMGQEQYRAKLDELFKLGRINAGAE